MIEPVAERWPFESTTSPKSERRLAHSLGYPKSWHVVRIAPHPADDSSAQGKGKTCLDTIYAGNPESNVDTYYNHCAAYDAALSWKEGESTGYDNGGGQMLAQLAQFKKGDEVEVLYEPDGQWYDATVIKVKAYNDDIRYTVHYTDEDATQSNIYENLIRNVNPGKKKKKSRQQPNKKNPAKKSKVTPKKRKLPEESEQEDASSSEKEDILEKPKKKKQKYVPDPDALKLASEMGLPQGWTARVRSNARYTFRNPGGTERFLSKKAVFEHLGLPLPPKEQKKNSMDSQKVSATSTKGNSEVISLREEAIIEEGDPPWRTSGNKYLGRRVYYNAAIGESSNGVSKSTQAIGTVTGWIADTDLDRDGNPGFVSERSGKPASLFHVDFDGEHLLASQDMEEYELIDSLVQDTDEQSQASDDIPLSTIAKNKNAISTKAPKRSKKKK